jgi:hypothetical protein
MRKVKIPWMHSYTYEEIKYVDPYEMRKGPLDPASNGSFDVDCVSQWNLSRKS